MTDSDRLQEMMQDATNGNGCLSDAMQILRITSSWLKARGRAEDTAIVNTALDWIEGEGNSGRNHPLPWELFTDVCKLIDECGVWREGEKGTDLT